MKSPDDENVSDGLSQLPMVDASPEAAERIHRIARGRFVRSAASAQSNGWLLGNWKDLLEVPLAAAIVAVYLSWAVQLVYVVHTRQVTRSITGSMGPSHEPAPPQ